MADIEVDARGIKLGQLLKLAGLVESGGSVKRLLDAHLVRVNGDVETRRGAHLQAGDVVTMAEHEVRLTGSSDAGQHG